MFDSISLNSFKYNVLRVLFQLESPNSEHRNSSYVRNNPDYSMFKAGTRIWLAHGPNLTEFLGNLRSEFGDTYCFSLVLLEFYFTYPLESLKSDKKLASYGQNTKTGRNWEQSSSSTGTCLTCTGTSWPKMTINEIVPVQAQIVPVQVSKKCPECVFFTHFSMF